MKTLSSVVLLILGIAIPANAQLTDDRPLLVCSTTQVADFARQVVGDRFRIESILAPGVDPHLYKIKPANNKLVSKAVLCFDNGWHLEGGDWMQTLAKNANKPIVTCVQGIKPLELPENGEAVRDPHAWFAVTNAAIYVRNITKAVAEIDPAHKLEYIARAELYLAKLRVLQSWMKKQFNAIPVESRVLVTSHDAFNYFCRDFGFKPAAPTGWSTGAEIGGGITPERRRKTVESIKSLGVKAIFVETSVSEDQIQAIGKDAGVKIGGKLYGDSMGERGSAGETYIGMMRENTLTIVNALR